VEDSEILDRFLKSNLNLHPSALEDIKRSPNIPETVNKIISKITRGQDAPEVITREYLRGVERPIKRLKKPPLPRAASLPLAAEFESELLIQRDKDITSKSFTQGDIEAFRDYFRDRFEGLEKILRERNNLRDAATIERVRNNRRGGEVQLIAMVSDIRKSKKGHVILEVEDLSGSIPVIILNSDPDLQGLAKEIVLDEVLGIVGILSRSGEIIIAKDILFPDIPVSRTPHRSEVPACLAIISDIHVGSSKFLEGVFLKFLKWLRGEIGSAKQRSLAEKVKYLIVGGDLVDGVGIYPGQENELLIRDIREQYSRFASLLSMVPEHVEIIVLPGNHDAVRQAEPQPAIGEEFAPGLYEDPRVHMVGNPCYATISGVDVLSYHGRSLDDIISTIPNQSYSKPEKAMLMLMKKRHLTPIYGGKVPLAPEDRDYMLIKDVPDILHLGHVHTVGVENYRGAMLINSGTFQSQTTFQRKMNMRPHPGEIPVVDLMEGRATVMRFM
jgi:DNA polymerase II small subunit